MTQEELISRIDIAVEGWSDKPIRLKKLLAIAAEQYAQDYAVSVLEELKGPLSEKGSMGTPGAILEEVVDSAIARIRSGEANRP